MLCFYLLLCVQIIVESFPVSSSGHSYLLAHFLKKCDQPFFSCADLFSEHGIYSVAFMQSFDHVLHIVTVAVLAFFFFSRWRLYVIRIRTCWPIALKIIGLAALADSATAFFYVFFKFYSVQLPLVIGFGVTACALLSLYFISEIKRASCAALTPSKALVLGLVQGIALLSGISRLATTYVVARWLGLRPHKAFEVSWVIAVPLFIAASMQGVYSIWRMPEVHELVYASIPYMVGAGICAYGALKLTAYLFYTGRGWWFGLYMVGLILLITFLH